MLVICLIRGGVCLLILLFVNTTGRGSGTSAVYLKFPNLSKEKCYIFTEEKGSMTQCQDGSDLSGSCLQQFFTAVLISFRL